VSRKEWAHEREGKGPEAGTERTKGGPPGTNRPREPTLQIWRIYPPALERRRVHRKKKGPVGGKTR